MAIAKVARRHEVTMGVGMSSTIHLAQSIHLLCFSSLRGGILLELKRIMDGTYMNSETNTLLISGSSEGTGFLIAKVPSDRKNRLVMTGRNAERIDASVTKLDKIKTLQAVVTKEEDVMRLTEQIKNNFAALNVHINNVEKTFVNRVSAHAGAFAKASAELLTNDSSNVRLAENPLPQPLRQTKAAIVDISSITAFALLNNLSAYAVSKACLHPWAYALRMRPAKSTTIKAFEPMMHPPFVTGSSDADGESSGISPRLDAGRFPESLKTIKYEIRDGRAAEIDFFHGFRQPEPGIVRA